jgi:hypothetical protein
MTVARGSGGFVVMRGSGRVSLDRSVVGAEVERAREELGAAQQLLDRGVARVAIGRVSRRALGRGGEPRLLHRTLNFAPSITTAALRSLGRAITS